MVAGRVGGCCRRVEPLGLVSLAEAAATCLPLFVVLVFLPSHCSMKAMKAMKAMKVMKKAITAKAAAPAAPKPMKKREGSKFFCHPPVTLHPIKEVVTMFHPMGKHSSPDASSVFAHCCI